MVKLANERKRLNDVLKIVAYQAASELLALLRPLYARADDEGRTLLHEIFAASGSNEVTASELRVTAASLSSPHRTAAVAALCDPLNLTATTFPGTNLRLVLAVQSDDRKTMAFPGPRAQSAPRQRSAATEPDTSRPG